MKRRSSFRQPTHPGEMLREDFLPDYAEKGDVYLYESERAKLE